MNILSLGKRIVPCLLSFVIAGSISGCQVEKKQSQDDGQSSDFIQKLINNESEGYISLGDSDNPLKFLYVEKEKEGDIEFAVGFGYFRWDYKRNSESDTCESIGFDSESGTFDNSTEAELFDLWFDNVVTGESINLSQIESTAAEEVRFYFTEAGNYFSLQSVIDNTVSRTELEEFIDSCTSDALNTYDYYMPMYREVYVNRFSVDVAAQEEDLNAVIDDKSLVKIK